MSDLVERLRRRHGLTHDPDQLWDVISTLNKDADEAAAEIERLQRLVGDMLHAQHKQEIEIERLRAQVVSLQSSLDAGPPRPGKKTPDALEKP